MNTLNPGSGALIEPSSEDQPYQTHYSQASNFQDNPFVARYADKLHYNPLSLKSMKFSHK